MGGAIVFPSENTRREETPVSALSAGMTREEAFELLAAHNKDPFHIEHG